MAKSFFERLTGSIRLGDEGSAAPAGDRVPAESRVTQGRGRKRTNAGPESSSVLHPVAAEGGVPAPAELPDEEGQLTVDIYDDGQYIVIQSTVAGVKPEDIDISLQEDTLTIRGQRKRTQEINEDNFYYKELYWGLFSRSIILPEEVDFQKADAVIKNGLLTIKMPKKDRGEKKISVKVG